ncbi:hypothetical protein ACFLWJ_00790 [Chloroflexota bacterium]
MKTKVYTKEEKEIVKEWATRWQQFFELIDNATGPGKLPPTEEEEIIFQKLRAWFIEKERIFVRLWNDFCKYRLQHCTDRVSADEIEALDEDNFVAFLKNPFGFYYRSGTFYTWAHHMGLQYSTITWEPNWQKMRKISPILGFLAKVLVGELMDWMDGQPSV